MKLGGVLIVTAPFNSITHFAPFHYATGLSRYFYQEMLPKYGFEIVEIKSNGNYFQYLAQELLRLPSVTRKYSKTNMFIWERMLISLLLRALSRIEKQNKKSEELLCFGYHILAKRTK